MFFYFSINYVFLFKLLRPGPTELADAKKIHLLSIDKRYASVVYSLSTYFIRSTHQAHVHCDFIRVKSLRLHKTFKRMNIPLFTSVFNIYEQQSVHVRYHPLTACTFLSASSWHPFNSHPLPIKTERRRKISFMERLNIVCSTDIERWKRMHLVIIVYILCVYIRRTWYIHLIR